MHVFITMHSNIRQTAELPEMYKKVKIGQLSSLLIFSHTKMFCRSQVQCSYHNKIIFVKKKGQKKAVFNCVIKVEG